MTGYQRPHADRVAELLTAEGPTRIVAVVGPRQTGKTTLVGQALRRTAIPHWLVAADDPTAHEAEFGRLGDIPGPEWLVGVWQRARREALASPNGFVLVLDEVQHIPDWPRFVKGLWDADRATGCPLRVVLLGSAPWDMLTGAHERLTGRFIPVYVRQWSLREMVAAFDFALDEYVFFGGYPGAVHLRHNADAWTEYVRESIIEPTVGRDILSLARVDKPALMRQLLELASECSSQIIAYDKMVGQLQDAGNATTLVRYIELLAKAGLVTGLPQYSVAPRLRRSSPPKLHVLDTAVMTSHLGYSLSDATADRTLWGRIVESAVGAHLHNTLPPAGKLHYWRRNDHEVDFVITRGPHVVGIEVKSGGRRKTTGGLEAFLARYPKSRTLLVGGAGVPLNEFLWEPAKYWLEPR